MRRVESGVRRYDTGRGRAHRLGTRGLSRRQRSDMHIIDLDQTALAMEKALHLIRGVVDARGSILFVNTRSQVRCPLSPRIYSSSTPHPIVQCLGVPHLPDWVIFPASRTSWNPSGH